MFESINTLHLVWAGILHITTVFSVLLTLLLISQVLRSQHIPSWLEALRNQSDRHYPQPVGAVREMFEGLILLGAYQL